MRVGGGEAKGRTGYKDMIIERRCGVEKKIKGRARMRSRLKKRELKKARKEERRKEKKKKDGSKAVLAGWGWVPIGGCSFLKRGHPSLPGPWMHMWNSLL